MENIDNKLKSNNSIIANLKNNIVKHPTLYLMAIPIILYYFIFHYLPMYGVLIAFQRFNPMKGIIGSKWIGIDNFKMFFTDVYFLRTFTNTLIINIYDLIFGFPVPIIFALLLNEIKNVKFVKLTQTLTYMPHFISAVVVCGILVTFTKSDGVITFIWSLVTGKEVTNLLAVPKYFRTIFTSMNVWQGFGWGSIIYFAALSSIDQEIYEAASIDGASRLMKAIKITIPSIAPTIVILLILRMGQMMNLGWEKIILLQSPLTYSTSDVISSYVYRRGIVQMDYSYGSAVGLFNSVVNMILILTANKISIKLNESSLW